jgi:hypothetical protein
MARIDVLEFSDNGIISVRTRLTVTGKGGPVETGLFHRTTIEPGANYARTLKAVNAHLASMNYDTIDEASWEIVRVAVAAVHTPQVISAFKSAQPPKA